MKRSYFRIYFRDPKKVFTAEVFLKKENQSQVNKIEVSFNTFLDLPRRGPDNLNPLSLFSNMYLSMMIYYSLILGP